MNKQKDTNSQRRKLLKTVAISGGVIGATQSMPEKWLKPVVDSVILPSHATTSDNSGSLAGNEAITTTPAPANKYYLQLDDTTRITGILNEPREPSLLEQISEGLVPSAHAAPSNYIERFFLEHLGGVLYHYVYQATGGLSGITYEVFYEGDIEVGQTRRFARQRCFNADDYDSFVSLDNVDSGHAYITNDKRSKILPLNMGASAPVFEPCVVS